MSMNLKDRLCVVMNDLENEGDLRMYSGRGMYGRECFASIAESHGDMWEVISMILDDFDPKEHQAVMQILWQYQSDSMGLDRVYYWPSLTRKEQA